MNTNHTKSNNAASSPVAAASPLPPLAEEGEAFRSLVRLEATAPGDASAPRKTNGERSKRTSGAPQLEQSDGRPRRHYDVIVIGAGQAGLSVGYYLSRHPLRFLILDAADRVGDSWRRRWDSLRLFTPARFDGLAGMPFPAPAGSFPTKDEMADYLERYAAHFQLPVGTQARVERLGRERDHYVLTIGDEVLEADQVVVAMATFQQQRVPELANDLRTGITQIFSSDYRNPTQLRPGNVLVVGAGNSGADIAMELARSGRPTWLSGRDTGQIPVRLDGWAAQLLLGFVFRIVFHRLLTIRTPWGRRVRARATSRGGALIRVKRGDLAEAGVQRVPRVVGARDGLPLLADGRVLDVANVVWCTGFQPGFSWIDLPIFDEHGDPRHDAGVARDEQGLYFVGLHFLYAMSSVMIHGVGRDAKRIAKTIAARHRRAHLAGPHEVQPRLAGGEAPRSVTLRVPT